MRINKFLAYNTDLSRRKADDAISAGRVTVNGILPDPGTTIDKQSVVLLDGIEIKNTQKEPIVLLVNKPEGYVCSKDGQGGKTVYKLIPQMYGGLNIAGRLDKDSSGLLVLTNNGELLNELTHPSNNKAKTYEVTVDKPIASKDMKQIHSGVNIGDSRLSKMQIQALTKENYKIKLQEGRNRQIRRTLSALGYKVISLHRTKLGPYSIEDLSKKVYNIV